MKTVSVADMHCDTISVIQLMRREGKNVNLRSNDMHVDLEKLKKGGYLLQTFAIFTDLEEGDPLEAGLEQADIFYQEMEANRDLIAPVTTVAQAERNQAEGKLSALLSIEGGGLCRGNISLLRDFYRLGVRMMTLLWNHENELGYPQTPRGRQKRFGAGGGRGLKEAGIAFLAEMERLGMIIDVSHLSDDGFYDVLHHTTRPFVASHSNARSLSPHLRNLTDEMLRALADRGGVAGANFCNLFLSPDGTDSLAVSTNEAIVRQIRHMVDVAGMDSVGLGTDYDGIVCALEMENCSMLQRLAQDLERDGFTAGQIEGIFYQNVLRVYREILG